MHVTLRSRLTVVLSTAAVVLMTAACGGGSSTPAEAPATPAPAADTPAAAPATPAAAPAGVIIPLEPKEGSSSGHIDLFRWEAVPGAESYVVKVTAVTDGRVLWESPALTTTEAHLPNTIALEPEAYFWQVKASAGGKQVAETGAIRFLVTP
jgi:hypothetical protein